MEMTFLVRNAVDVKLSLPVSWQTQSLGDFVFGETRGVSLPYASVMSCACCGFEGPFEKLLLSDTVYGRNRQTTRSMVFPVCPECRKHATRMENLILLVGGAMVVALLVVMALAYSLHEHRHPDGGPEANAIRKVTAWVIIGAAASVIVASGVVLSGGEQRLGRVFKVRRSTGCSTLGRPVVMSMSGLNDVILKFTNESYARRFCASNRQLIRRIRGLGRVDGKRGSRP